MSFLFKNRHKADSAPTSHSAPRGALPPSPSSSSPATRPVPDIPEFGLTAVYTPQPPSSTLVDLVFVHGLGGHPQKTWTSKKTGVFWPGQLLPQYTQQQRIQVWVYGYDANPTSKGGQGASTDMIHDHSEHLVAELAAKRREDGATKRPIIFVAHSLGGLVVKRALVYSSEITSSKTEHLRSVYVSTSGIIFLGTPHKGSELGEWGSYLEWLCHAVVPKKVLDTQPHLVNALKTNSETLQLIDTSFSKIMKPFNVYYFYEAKPTDFKGTYRYVVDKESAAPNLPDVERAGIQADHSGMCKFDDARSPGFDLAVDAIKRYAEASVNSVPLHWEGERRKRSIQQTIDILEIDPEAGRSIHGPDSVSLERSNQGSAADLRSNLLLGSGSHSRPSSTRLIQFTAHNEPYYFVPPGFRQNACFVGHEEALAELDQRLFDTRRETGTASALLHGQPGVGKSSVAIQYVTQNRSKFPGGIFWLGAHLLSELQHDFWLIAQRIVARDSPELLAASQSEQSDFIDAVREWFQGRHEWLIVLDGVMVETNEDVSALQRFIPDSSNCSIIYIARPKRLATSQRLLRPYPIKVSPLSLEDGRMLLFNELQIDKPRQAQIDNANKLVHKVGGLPLAISAIASRIADTGQLIEKYHQKSYSNDPVLGDTYLSIIDDLVQHEHQSAFNLMALLCFFGPNVPVEMIRLGLNALKSEGVEVRSSEDGSGPDLNASFAILMRHALLQRNEPDDNASSPTDSRSSSVIIEPDPIDMLKIPTVFSKFFADSLAMRNQLAYWLALAARLFVCSFQEANARIKRSPQPARVSDYRQYLMQGQSLLKSVTEHRSKGHPLSYIRGGLQPIVDQIKDEIRSRESSSSQESIEQREFQKSVFDRSYSSSSSAQSEDLMIPPSRRLDPPPVSGIEDEYGIPLNRSDTEEPKSLEAFSSFKEPRIASNSPPSRFLQGLEDFGSSQPMEKELSGSTIRPHQSPLSQSPDWESRPVHRRQTRKQAFGLGSFHPVPANPTVEQLTESVATRPPLSQRERSAALNSLTSLARPSTTRPQPNRGWSLWPRRPVQAPPNVDTSTLIYPDPLTNPGHPMPTEPPNLTYTPPEPQLLPLESTEYDSPTSSQSLVTPPAVVSSLQNQVFGHQRSSSSPLRSSYSAQDVSNTDLQLPAVVGPNPNPLPYTTIPNGPMPSSRVSYQSNSPPSSTRPRFQSVPDASQPFQAGAAAPPVPSHESQAPGFPLGYSSQPVTRDNSQQSLRSGTATEPPPEMPFSPPDGSSPAQFLRARQKGTSSAGTSPKLSAAQPAQQRGAQGSLPQHQTPLAGAGDWARATDPLPQSSPLATSQGREVPSSTSGDHRPRSTSMSRPGSGPGMLVRDSAGGVQGLGIAEFGEGRPQIVPIQRVEEDRGTAEVEPGSGMPLVPDLSSTSLNSIKEEERLKEAPYPEVDEMPGK